MMPQIASCDQNHVTMSTVPRWNFEKFLLDHRGQPVRRYDESLDPSEIVPDIDTLLDNLAMATNTSTETEAR